MASAPKSAKATSVATLAYLVLVGQVVTGSADERVEVSQGNTVDLTTDEAAPLLARGIIAPASDAAAAASPPVPGPQAPGGDGGLAGGGDGQSAPQT